MSARKLTLAAIISGIIACVATTNVFAEPFVIDIEDPEFYTAVKDCIQNHSITPDEYHQLNNSFSALFSATTACVSLDDAAFDDTANRITFEDGEDFKSRSDKAIILPNADISSAKDAFKFGKSSSFDDAEYSTLVFLPNNNIARLDFSDIHDFYNLIWNLQLSGNKIGDIKIDDIFSVADDYITNVLCAQQQCGYGNIMENLAIGAYVLPAFFEGRLVYQQIEDDYSGDKYALPDTIKSEAKYLKHMAGLFKNVAELIAQDDEVAAQFSSSQKEFVNMYAEIFNNYYDIDKWLVLENATLSDDGEYLIPIDSSKDMSISFRRAWDDVSQMDQDADNFYRDVIMGTDDLKIVENNSEYHTLASLTVHHVASNPNTSDNAFNYLAATSSAITLAGAVIYAKTRR